MNLFFSIIVPAHNEEKYIEQTLKHLQDLDYPKDKYEVIVVENGSTDETFAVARKFESENTKILSFPERGVAFARNRGIEVADQKAHWVLFIDADTLVGKECLTELSTFLSKSKSELYSLGTGSIKPIPVSIVANFYFFCCDIGHMWTKTAYGAFFIVRRDILEKHRFDEALSITEDGEICASARESGNFFFMPTSSVRTSTRRFDTQGWLWTLLSSSVIALFPLEIRRRFAYAVIR